MIESYKRFWTRLGDFSGTSSRSDYWWAILINYIIGVLIAAIIQAMTGHSMTTLMSQGNLFFDTTFDVIGLILWFGTLSLRIRRLHDSNHSGWWVLISWIPIIGQIWFFVFMVWPSEPSRWSN